MDFRLALSALILAGALAQPGAAQAAPISLSSDDVVDPDVGITGAFEHLFELEWLSTGGRFDFSLRALTEGSATNDLTIHRVVFSNGSGSVRFDAAADGSQLRLLGDAPLSFGSFTDSQRSYELDPLTLGAGSWNVAVYGTDADNKLWSSYVLQGVPSATTVPEPAGLALVLMAGLIAARSRRKA